MRGTAKLLLLPLLGALVFAPAVAEAKPDASLLQNLDVSGAVTDAANTAVGTFDGTANITGLALDDQGNLSVTGVLNGVVSGDGGLVEEVTNQVFTTAATLLGTGSKGKCQILNLDLGPLNLDLLGLVVDLSEVNLDIAAQRGPGKLLGNLLCGLVGLLDGPNLLDRARGLIDRINDIIGGLLTNVPVTGALPGGDFTGFLNITNIAVNDAGQLVVSGLLNGVATVGDTVTPIVNQAFSVVASLTGGGAAAAAKKPRGGNGGGGSCDILNLDLGPLNLDLLGLMVDLSPIELDITAQRGSGKLLGNLLCAIAGLLDSGSPLDDLLGRINNLLG